MYERIKKAKENIWFNSRQESRTVGNSVAQKKVNAKQRFGFVDNRLVGILQKNMQLHYNNPNVGKRNIVYNKVVPSVQKLLPGNTVMTTKKNEVASGTVPVQRKLNRTFENLPAANPAVSYDSDGTPHAPFNMQADWTTTLPDRKNERYKWDFIQEVRGEFTTQDGTKAPVVERHPLTPGVWLHDTNWQVDGNANGAYGPSSANVYGNAWAWNGSVLEFRAHDDPGHDPPVNKNETRRTDLKFRAKFLTKNTVGGVTEDSGWTYWDVIAESSKDGAGTVHHI